MKKSLSVLLILLLVFALAACGDADRPESVSPPLEQDNISESSSSESSGENAEQKSPVSDLEEPITTESSTPPDNQAIPTISIQVGDSSFTATLYDNDSTRALLAQMPMTLDMSDMNRNEKYYFFSNNFPTDSERGGDIRTGDLMLYGSDCLVLFYESFSTSYSYTRLGYVENASGLANALGEGNVQVTFAVVE